MKNYTEELFKEISVDNVKLKTMIEGKVLNLIVLGNAKENYDYKILWDTLDCYRNYISSNFKVYIYDSQFENNKILKKILHYYNLEEFVEIINNDNKKDLLTIFLGSDMAFLLNHIEDKHIDLIDYFMLPCVVTDKNLLKNNNNFLYVERNPEDLASAFSVLNTNIDYRRKLVS